MIQISRLELVPREQGGLVYERMNVYCVQNSKIAGNYPTTFFSLIYLTFLFSDCSIAPGDVGVNTYNTAVAIGEKATVIIAEDLGIKSVTFE